MVHLFDVPGNITALLKQDISSVLCDAFIALAAGIFEETIFRGIGADTFCAWYKETNHPLCLAHLNQPHDPAYHAALPHRPAAKPPYRRRCGWFLLHLRRHLPASWPALLCPHIPT